MIDSIISSKPTEVRRDSDNPALDCYAAAIRNIAHYAADLEPELTAPYRKHLNDLADRVSCGDAATFDDSRSTLRALLRDYRDKSSQYLNVLREDLNSAAIALAEILESLGDTDGEQGDELRGALRTLRQAPGDDCDSIRDGVGAAAKTIENCLAGVRKRHQLSVSQFMIEIRMLHKRIDALESAASVDMLTHLFPRPEMESRIRESRSSSHLLLVRAAGILDSASEFGRAVSEELTGAVIRRMRNTLPAATVVARWSGQAFVATLTADAAEAEVIAAQVAANLSGPYACMKDGRCVQPVIQPDVRLLEVAPGGGEDALRRIEELLSD
jgi:GGDEF domain-containing protein